MSEPEHQATDTLLPSASISVFSNDSETLESAHALGQDWRFARVTVHAVQGDVEAAIEKFREEGSTELVIIQTDDINEEFAERLGELSNHCSEDTAAIIVGPVNDVYLYRKLIEMGVSDYLVRPITPEILKEVTAKALIQRLGVSDSRIIAFMGAKGGVGTSSIAQMCSYITSEKMGQKTILMDAAGGWSPISVGMGFDPSATLFEIARAAESGSEDTLKRVMHEANGKLAVLASGADAMLDASVSNAQYESILDNFMIKFPVVFVDLSGAEATVQKAVLARAHQIIVVTEPTVTSLRFCRSLIKEIAVVRGGQAHDISLLVNKVGIAKGQEVSRGDIGEALEFKLSSVIDYDPALFLKYESEIKDIFSDKDGGDLVAALLPVLKKTLTGEAVAESNAADGGTGLLGGFLSKMKSK